MLDARGEAALLRRAATADAVQTGLTSEIRSRLNGALVLSAGDENLQVSVANSLGWLEIAAGHYDKALDVLFPLADSYQRSVFKHSGQVLPTSASIWNVAELLHNFAIALAEAKPSRYKTRARKSMARAQQLFRMSGAQQYEIFQGFSEEIAHRNITSGILGSADRERRPLPKELDKAMREILKLVRS